MNRFLASFFAMAAVAAVHAQTAKTTAVSAKVVAPEFDQTTILVKMRPGASSILADQSIGAVEIASMPQIGWRAVRVPPAFYGQKGVNYYKGLATVQDAGLRYKLKLDFTPNDPDFATRQYAPQTVQAPIAWDLSIGSPNSIVAIADTGIDFTHPEFQNGKALPGWDFSENDSDPTDDLPFDQYENHGVHCAGIAGANFNNGIGIAGMGGNIRILPIKVFPNSFDDVVAQAIIFAADQGAKTISLSLGRSGPKPQIQQDAVNYAMAKGTVVVAAAGNDAQNNDVIPHWPANLDQVVSVGATGRNDVSADFSDYGQSVDIAAPGVDIWSTVAVANGSFFSMSGTSMACPAVAGAAGLLWSYAGPNAAPADIIEALKSTTDPIALPIETGRMNLGRAISSVFPPMYDQNTLVGAANFPGGYNLDFTKAQAVDGNILWAQPGLVKGVGQVAALQFKYTQTDATKGKNILTGAVDYNVTSNFSGTLQFYLKDIVTGQYRLVTQKAYSPGTRFVDFSFNPNLQMTSGGTLEMLVRLVVPSNIGGSSGLQFGVDMANCYLRFKDQPAP